jgi:hypothetical protein
MKKINIPKFKYGSRDANKNYVIELEGEVVHRIEDIKEFYQALGYSEDIAKAGLLPDEYIWEKFIKDAETKCHQCFQLHIFKYLHQQSARFREIYQANLEEWSTVLAMAKLCGTAHCPSCKNYQPSSGESC